MNDHLMQLLRQLRALLKEKKDGELINPLMNQIIDRIALHKHAFKEEYLDKNCQIEYLSIYSMMDSIEKLDLYIDFGKIVEEILIQLQSNNEYCV